LETLAEVKNDVYNLPVDQAANMPYINELYEAVRRAEDKVDGIPTLTTARASTPDNGPATPTCGWDETSDEQQESCMPLDRPSVSLIKARKALCLPKITNAIIHEKANCLITETLTKTASSSLYLKRKVDRTGTHTFPMFC
jgi:hypothetical protein